jgi:hypothetical protein
VLEHFFLLPQISKQKVSVAQSLPETWYHSRDTVLTFMDLIIMVWLLRSVLHYLTLQTSNL